MDVIVEHNEDIGRTGFSGLLEELDSAPAPAAESPESWSPVGVSRGADDTGTAEAVDRFCAWLHDQRERLAS